MVGQRHFNPLFLARFSPFLAPFSRAFWLPGAKTEKARYIVFGG